VTAATPTAEPAVERSTFRSVAIPTEHGGWGLTLEPGLLGLLIAPGPAGICIAAGAMVAFLVRTPLKLVAVDRRRGRTLGRTRLARKVAAAELAVLAALAGGAIVLAEPWFWVPGIMALPLLVLEGWFDVRSRGRRLVPELAGAVGVCSVAAMVVLAGGDGARLAAGAWTILAARVATSIPHVRAQIARLRHRPPQAKASAAGDAAAAGLALVAIGLDRALLAGAIAVVAVIAVQRVATTRPVPRPVILGLRQMAMGFGVVIVTALGAALTAT
jgi:hypothetical protein